MDVRPSFPFTVTSRDVWHIALPASLAFITEPLVGWLSLHLWFIARGGLYWWSLERRRASLFA